MKQKYEKMIDAYVKKHYGDLERGVLAPEVKYKTLFKIYRKKYRKEKILAETFSRMLTEGLTIIPASCKSGKSMTACCPFYSVKVDEKKAQKEMSDLHEVCGNCAYFKEGKGKNKSTCTKDDTFVTKNCSCYEFEDKDKTQDSCPDWMHDDITWCRRECSNMDCERNSRNRRCKEGLFSAADMFDPFKCPVDAEMPKNNP